MLNLFIHPLSQSGVYALIPEPQEEGRVYTYANKSWSWWTNPLLQYDPATNTSYASVVNAVGSQELLSINHTTGEENSRIILSGQAKDEHNTAGFLVQEDGILWATANRNQNGFYYVGKVSKDLGTMLQPATNVHSQVNAIGACYASMYEVGSRTFSFYRSAHHAWHFIYSDDFGVTWQPHIKLIEKIGIDTDAWLYIIGQQVGQTHIKFTAYANAGTSDPGTNRIVAFTLNTSTGEVTCGGVSYGSCYEASWQMLAFYNLPTVIQLSGTQKIRLSDVCGEGDITHMAVVDFLENDRASGFPGGDYRYVQFNHDTSQVLQSIPIVGHGRDHGYASYFGGIFFRKTTLGVWDNKLYLSREENEAWYCEEYTYNGTSFTLSQTIDQVFEGIDGRVIMRPQPPVNSAQGGVRLWYTKGVYHNDQYIDWTTEMIGYTAGALPVKEALPVFFEGFHASQTGNHPISTRGWKGYANAGGVNVSTLITHTIITSSGLLAIIGSKDRALAFKETPVPAFTRATWQHGNANTTAKSYLAVRIGSSWFRSLTGFNTTVAVASGAGFEAGKETAVLELTGGAEWVPLTFTAGSALSSGTTPQALPVGSINAVGFFVQDTSVNSATLRFDNLTLI